MISNAKVTILLCEKGEIFGDRAAIVERKRKEVAEHETDRGIKNELFKCVKVA